MNALKEQWAREREDWGAEQARWSAKEAQWGAEKAQIEGRVVDVGQQYAHQLQEVQARAAAELASKEQEKEEALQHVLSLKGAQGAIQDQLL